MQGSWSVSFAYRSILFWLDPHLLRCKAAIRIRKWKAASNYCYRDLRITAQKAVNWNNCNPPFIGTRSWAKILKSTGPVPSTPATSPRKPLKGYLTLIPCINHTRKLFTKFLKKQICNIWRPDFSWAQQYHCKPGFLLKGTVRVSFFKFK